MPLVGAETPRFVPLPAVQRHGPPLPDLFGAALRRYPAAWAAAALTLGAGVALQWPGSSVVAWLARHGVLPMPLCSAPRWSLADGLAVFAMWCAMLAFMGLGGLALRLRAAWRLPRSERASAWRLLLSCCTDGAPAAFAWGHVATALALALLLTAINGVLANAGLVGNNTALRAPWAGPWLIALGLWQCLPMQGDILARAIERPLAQGGLPLGVLLLRGWRWGWRQAAAEFPAMLALFALGIMNLGWMALHLLLGTVQQRWPRHRLVLARLQGLFWLMLGTGLSLQT